MQIDEIVDRMLADPSLAANVVAHREIPARIADSRPFPPSIEPRIVAALATRGITSLFSHQAEAIEAVLQGRNPVVVTPTASGKTLCYNLPVLNTILGQPDARALYLFPTKALAQDQSHELHTLVTALGADIKTYTYDGDTPQDARKAIRTAGHIVITNPDMLHTGILPHHTRWYRLFENLRYVVIDEMHVYRGVFGSHVANVIRRLKRIARYYGSDPLFICCSATIANPAELATRLIDADVTLIDTNGAPSGRKHVLLYNPPVVNRELGLRAGSRTAAKDVAALFLRNQVQTIVFARSRTGVELLLGYLREAVGRGKASSVRGYRSGYLPLQRREIERGLRDGAVRGVVATNALELGIDIGALDACVVTGFPGTIASAWQQMGRAGRRSESSVAVLVFNSGPLDQFLASNHEYFFERSPEAGLVDANNLIILLSHIKCAAFELPFQDGEIFGVETTREVLLFLEENGVVQHRDGVWHWTSDSFPAQEISLRSATTDNVVIIQRGPPAQVIGEIDRASAPTMLHEEAIYLHEGQQYQVEVLDLEEKKAFVTPVDVDYYTDAEQAVKVRVLEVSEATEVHAHGEVEITYLPTIYKKIRLHTHENVGWGNIHLDEDPYPTTAYWLAISDSITAGMTTASLECSLRGLAHVLGNVGCLFLMCDPNDLGTWTEIKAPFTRKPTVFVYDRIPGGIGFSQRLYTMHRQLLARAGHMISHCPCERGCPGCIGPQYINGANPKMTTIGLAAALLDRSTALVSSARS